MIWFTVEEESHFHFNYICKRATLWLQLIVLKEKTSWKENKIQGVVVSTCADLLSTVYCTTTVSSILGNTGKPPGFASRLEPMKKALFSLFLFILLGQLKCIEWLRWDLQMFCIKRSRIINSDMQMYLFIVPQRQSQRHFWGFPEHSVFIRALGCWHTLFPSLSFSFWINGIFLQSPAQLLLPLPCPAARVVRGGGWKTRRP